MTDIPPRVDTIFLDFGNAFDIVSQHIILDKMSNMQLGKNIMWWVSNCLMCRAQSVGYV